MNLQEAKKLLDKCTRTELRDHAFGDVEVTWTHTVLKNFVASGYFGGDTATVGFVTEEIFEDDDARALRGCGTPGQIERNDENGPNDFQEGAVMPGLTKEGVLKELTGGE